jgi:serine/threonine protein kinase
MTPERWRQIKQIFDAALAQDVERLPTFLAAACAGDEELRGQVEAMLLADARTDELLDRPAYAAIPELLDIPENQSQLPTEPLAESLIGRRIGVYQLERELGRGGMGEVYLAYDARLGRNVALKLLPARYTEDAERVRRFQREARAASALNHPNILTIFDIGQEDRRHYIATEFVEGQTLRSLVGGDALSLDKAIDVTIQIAGALAAAHQAGIVHRDIKPENVMVRPDGYVKVLDFGLAKLTELDSSSREGETGATRSSVFETRTGVILGTVAYMSPEQARGEKVDARSDLFSLGVALYELIAGARPFTGATPNHILVSILDQEPPPLSQRVSSAAPQLRQLQRIVSRALSKDRDDRYQSATEFLADLKQLKEELAVGARLERLRTSGELRIEGDGAPAPAITTDAVTERKTRDGLSLLSDARRRRHVSNLLRFLHGWRIASADRRR